jgi:hypothetical protein
MSQPPDRFPIGWYAWDEELQQAARVREPSPLPGRFVRAAVAAAIGNAAIQLLAFHGWSHAAQGVYSLVWAFGCVLLGINAWATYQRPPWRAQLATGAGFHLAQLALGWAAVAGGQPTTWPRIAAGAAQLVVVIAAGSVYLWAGRAGRQS